MAAKSIIAYFDDIPDPRRGAGQRHEQTLVLILLLMSTMSGYIGYRAVGDFIKRNKESLLKDLHPKKNRLPSFDTVRRVIQEVDFSMIVNNSTIGLCSTFPFVVKTGSALTVKL